MYIGYSMLYILNMVGMGILCTMNGYFRYDEYIILNMLYILDMIGWVCCVVYI